MSHDIKVLIRDCEDDALLIWETLKTSFIQQQTVPHFNVYHTLLSVEKSDSETLDSLINRVDKQIRVIKLLSPSSFTLDNLYDKLAVMAIIRALPHSFDDVVQTISVLDKFDKQSVVQSLRNMDQTHANLSSTTSTFAASLAPLKHPQNTSTLPASSSSSSSSQTS
jgi:translation initiation factor 2B subunit (eIF-2B alpha/beta/delta family)